MIAWWWLGVMALFSAALGVVVTAWVLRRVWRGARRLSARGRRQEQLAELGQLAGGLAHEIKNPLSTINLNLKLLSEDIARVPDDLHARWLRRLRGVQAEADVLKGILDDFLQYAGKHELNLEPADLGRLVSELADFFAPQAEATQIVLRATLGEDPIPCRLDVHLIKQALLNLMLNAVQAMDSTQGGELILRLTRDSRVATLEIIDTGTGIPEEELGKVFEVFYSTKKRGTGLGLPTTRRIIREHGGSIHVESEVGQGTRFTIRLPLRKDVR
jgi:signal transduction histidine kinase